MVNIEEQGFADALIIGCLSQRQKIVNKYIYILERLAFSRDR